MANKVSTVNKIHKYRDRMEIFGSDEKKELLGGKAVKRQTPTPKKSKPPSVEEDIESLGTHDVEVDEVEEEKTTQTQTPTQTKAEAEAQTQAMTHKSILRFFLKLQTTIRLYHWTTLSYARHMASDKLDATLMPLIDDFVESFLAEFERPPRNLKSLHMKCFIASDDRMKKYLARKRLELLAMNLPTADLDSIRDEIAGAIGKALYLFETI